MSENVPLQDLASLPVETLLEKIAGDRPLLPAAGSAVALVGATSAALGGFVSRIARRHAETEPAALSIDPIVSEFDRIRRQFAGLMTEDVRAYTEALAMMRGDDRETEAAREKMAGPPEAMARSGVALLERFIRIMPFLYEPTHPDAATGAELARTCTDNAIRIWRASGTGQEGDGISARIENLIRTRDLCCKTLDRLF